jgi:hypothetical protein
MLSPELVDSDSKGPKHGFFFHEGRIFIESLNHWVCRHEDVKKRLKREFGEFKCYLVDEYKQDSPEIWQRWWANRLHGNDNEFMTDDDGPWNSRKEII